jgi:sulfite exporter TauE/SafE
MTGVSLPWVGMAGGVLGASLLGSVHCAAMCGGFVCWYGGGEGGHQGGARLHDHALYNGGRLAAYLLLGAVAGALGGAVTAAGEQAGVQQGAVLLAGTLIVGWAVAALAARRGVSLAQLPVPAGWQRVLGRVLQQARLQPVGVRALLTGLLTTLLPCGWLYVFVATAGGTGSVAGGMALMAIFWLGTVPALLAVGMGAQRLLLPLRRRFPAAGPAVVLTLGVLALAGRLAPLVTPGAASHAAHGPAASGPSGHKPTAPAPAAPAPPASSHPQTHTHTHTP